MNPVLVQRPDKRLTPALVSAGLGLLSRPRGESSKSLRPCACTSGSQSTAQAPWAFRAAGSTGECTSGGRCGGDCCGGGGCSSEPQYKRATTKAMPGGEKCPPFTRFPRPKDPPRKPEHPKHPTKPKSPVSTKPPAPEPPRTFPTPPFGGWGCFTPAVENPTHGPYEPDVMELIWRGGALVDIDTAFPDAESRRLAEHETWTVRGLCAQPAGVTGPVPFVLMMHQNSGAGRPSRGYVDLQRLLASHGIASVSASDNDHEEEEPFTHPGLEFSDEARRAALCVQLAERFAVARGLSFGPQIGLLGHSRGGWAAQNLATLINRGSDNLIGLADNPESFAGSRVEALCLVGTSSHHALAPSCPILLIQGSRDEDLLLDPSWWLAGRSAAGFVSVAYVFSANHNSFNSEHPDGVFPGGRTGPNSSAIRPVREHVRILTGLAGALFLQTLAGRQTALVSGTSVLPQRSATPDYRIAYRASDCVALIREFGASSVNRGRELTIDSLAIGATHTPDTDVQAAVFNGLNADAQEWPSDVSVYFGPGDRRPAIICCGHGLVIRQRNPTRQPPNGVGAGVRIPLPGRVVDLREWMIAVTAASVDPRPSFLRIGTPTPPTFMGGGLWIGVESPIRAVGPAFVGWSGPRRLDVNEDLQAEMVSRLDIPIPGTPGFQRVQCKDDNWARLNHRPYYCDRADQSPRNNGTTAFATTHWFPADCFPVPAKDEPAEAIAVWLYPDSEAPVAIQRVDLIRRARLRRD
jgi:hypothetical protein